MRALIWAATAFLLPLAPLVRGDQELLIDHPPHNMEMGVQVRPDTFSMGDTITILISATNREPETIRLRFRTGCPFAFRITAPDGAQVDVHRGCRLGLDSLVLMPGEMVWDTLIVAVEAPIQTAERPDSITRRGVIYPPVGTVFDPTFEPPPRIEWPCRGEKVLEGVYRVEGGVRGQEFRWAAVDARVR